MANSGGEVHECNMCGAIKHISQLSESAKNDPSNPFRSNHHVLGSISQPE